MEPGPGSDPVQDLAYTLELHVLKFPRELLGGRYGGREGEEEGGREGGGEGGCEGAH